MVHRDGQLAGALCTTAASYCIATHARRTSWLYPHVKRSFLRSRRPRLRDSTWCTSSARSASMHRYVYDRSCRGQARTGED
eukprot:3504017-Heterocapsa_arctica.AAC.1